ncbi:MAG: BamA/TamA family outer membrane protein [Syntrophothermus sp.]
MKIPGKAILFISLLFVGVACNVTKNFSPGEYLLVSNKFRIDNRKINKDELSGYLQQVPNQKLFGLFRPGVALYNYGSKGKETKFKKWVRTRLGSPPVKLDTNMNIVARKQMSLYLANKGYFGSHVRDSVDRYKKHKARVYYLVKAREPYLIRRITYSIPDTGIYNFLMKDTTKCLLERGKNYDAYLISDERARITANLMNYGFYRFSNTYIFFHIDSTLANHEVDINIEIKNPLHGIHQRFFFNNIYIYPEFDLLQIDTLSRDTLVRTFKGPGSDTTMNSYYFLTSSHKKISVSPSIIAQAIIIKKGQPYNQTVLNTTYANLSGLQVFKFVNIQFTEIPGPDTIGSRLLDCKIQLSRSMSQTFSISTDGTNSSGAFGVQGNFSSQHRNIFGGAQILRLNLSASAQLQGNLGNTLQNDLLSTVELGASATLSFPQFLLPVKPEKFAKKYRPKTNITIGYNYQLQPDYNRHITNATFGYSFNQNIFLSHVINPVELSFVKIYPDSAFSAKLEETSDKRLKNQYTDHMVAGLRWTITFRNQDITRLKDFTFIRSNIETGGNLLYVADKILGAKKQPNGSYNVFGIPYAQYIRPDFDFRYYHLISSFNSLVGRFYGGIGIPYGNSTTLPFEKAFFAGGANDLRGWKMGTLGPGSYNNDSVATNFDQTGDLQLQVNFEYRFPVYSFIRSAVFLDAGNIWLLNNNPEYPGGKFQFNTFYKQIAVDMGLGLRADFDFFIFRLDPAVPVIVPWSANQWYVNKLQLKDIIWNFGIGYPF